MGSLKCLDPARKSWRGLRVPRRCMPCRVRRVRNLKMTVLDAVIRSIGSIAELREERTADDRSLNDSIKHVALTGWLIIAIFFGGIGTWAATAPLNGAVVANAVVKVDGNRKSVQHLDGGIVKEQRVKEGDRVAAGEVLIVLDDTQARAEFEVLAEQYLVLRATEVRLLAELAGETELIMPPELAARQQDLYARSIWAGQIKQFES